MRKFLLILVLVFVRDTYVQSYLYIAIFILALTIALFFDPYSHSILNYFEILSAVSLFAVVYNDLELQIAPVIQTYATFQIIVVILLVSSVLVMAGHLLLSNHQLLLTKPRRPVSLQKLEPQQPSEKTNEEKSPGVSPIGDFHHRSDRGLLTQSPDMKTDKIEIEEFFEEINMNKSQLYLEKDSYGHTIKTEENLINSELEESNPMGLLNLEDVFNDDISNSVDKKQNKEEEEEEEEGSQIITFPTLSLVGETPQQTPRETENPQP